MVKETLTIGYTYYNNAAGWKEIQKYYRDCSHNKIVVDDASPNPIELNNSWITYKINEDIGWNNEGARNLIVQQADTEWVALIDMDWYLKDFNVDLSTLRDDTLYVFRTPEARDFGGGSFHNQILVNREYFLCVGGYFLSQPGKYGLDGTLKNKYNNYSPLNHKLFYNHSGTSEDRTGKDDRKPTFIPSRELVKSTTDLHLPFTWKRLL